MTTKTITVTSCDTCPYGSGWDPMDCKKINDEKFFCAFERKTRGPGNDIESDCVNRQKMHGKLPIPKWCPLPYTTMIATTKNEHTLEWLKRIKKEPYK